MSQMICSRCGRPIRTGHAMTCAHCGAVVCENCAADGVCTHCYGDVRYGN